MIRLTALWLFIACLMVWSWKDWYKGLCGLILLMAVIEHPDMPKSIFGIPGLNAWNLLLFNVCCAWMAQRGRERLTFDMPRSVTLLLVGYLMVMLVGFGRIIGDTGPLEQYYEAGFSYFINEYLVNSIKWVIPGLLLYDGCRSEERFRWGLTSVLAVYVLLAVQVAKWIPPQYALDADALEARSLRVLVSDMGYHRVNLSAMLAGASWAVLSTKMLVSEKKRWLIPLVAVFIVYAQMMTAGRAGYGAWVVVGLALAVTKWRRYLLLIPVAAMATAILAPGVVGRALEGFTAESHDTNTRVEEARQDRPIDPAESSDVDAYTVTAGRSVAWPLVIEKIAEQPWIGYGRQAMLRTGTSAYLRDTFGESFPHPHNAYLELLFDTGVVGFLIVVPFYLLMLFYAFRLFRDRESPTCAAIGGVAAAFMVALMVSAVGSQTFYPREGWVGMWCAIGLMLRVRVERAKRVNAAADTVAATVATRAKSTRISAVARARGPAPVAPAAAAAYGAGTEVPAYRHGDTATVPGASAVGRNFSSGKPQPAGFFSSALIDRFVWERA